MRHVTNETSRYFSYYFYGFPKKFHIYDILPVQNLLISQVDDIQDVFKNHDDKNSTLNTFDVSTSIKKLIVKRLELLKATRVASAADFLCLTDYETLEIGLCSLKYLHFFKNKFEFFFDGDDHLEIVYIYFRCLIHGIGLNETFGVRQKTASNSTFNRFCPNPCLPLINADFIYERNPCVSKANTKNHECTIPNKLILYENNYTCNCKLNYVWDPLLEECVYLKKSCMERNLCYRKNTRDCHIYMHTKPQTEINGFKAYEYEIKCECFPLFMGPECSLERNACIENLDKSKPPGNVACGFNGRCKPLRGTNYYTCICDSGWYDDLKNDYIDCYERIDKCNQINCHNNGYCKASVNNEIAICVCDQKYTGNSLALLY